MSHNSGLAKVLRFMGIVLMALTAGFTILGGAGTSCAAFNPLNPDWADSMGPLAQMQWLYIFYVFATIAIGVAGIRATVLLVKGAPQAYRDTLLTLAAGLVIGVIHVITSRALRGKSMPVDMVVYVTILTLVIFLIYRIPAIWHSVNYDKTRSNGKMAGSAAMVVLGAVSLAIPSLAGPTHTWGGANYADAFHALLTPLGWILIVVGSLMLVWHPINQARAIKNNSLQLKIS